MSIVAVAVEGMPSVVGASTGVEIEEGIADTVVTTAPKNNTKMTRMAPGDANVFLMVGNPTFGLPPCHLFNIFPSCVGPITDRNKVSDANDTKFHCATPFYNRVERIRFIK